MAQTIEHAWSAVQENNTQMLANTGIHLIQWYVAVRNFFSSNKPVPPLPPPPSVPIPKTPTTSPASTSTNAQTTTPASTPTTPSATIPASTPTAPVATTTHVTSNSNPFTGTPDGT